MRLVAREARRRRATTGQQGSQKPLISYSPTHLAQKHVFDSVARQLSIEDPRRHLCNTRAGAASIKENCVCAVLL